MRSRETLTLVAALVAEGHHDEREQRHKEWKRDGDVRVIFDAILLVHQQYLQHGQLQVQLAIVLAWADIRVGQHLRSFPHQTNIFSEHAQARIRPQTRGVNVVRWTAFVGTLP